MARKTLNRTLAGTCSLRISPGIAAIGVALATSGANAAGFAFDGTEFHPVGVLAGDQGASSIALGSSGGLLVWQDNATDGDGLGISARRITAAGSPAGSVFRVNQLGTGDQEKPQAVRLADGSTLIAWQGGPLGAQSIYARLLGPDGVFRTEETLVSAGSDNCQDVSLAALDDGKAAVVWSSNAADGNMQGLFVRRIGTDGLPLQEMIRVNQFTQFNQRSASVAPLQNGGFVVAWVSEQQTGSLKADIFARSFGAMGTATGSEFRVNGSPSVCGMPQVAPAPDGSLWFLWTERTAPTTGQGSWDIQLRRYDAQLRALGPQSRLNSVTAGDQTGPKVAFAGSDALVVWTSWGIDGSGKGVAGGLVTLAGQPHGADWVLNTTKHRDQIEPVVGSGGFQSWVTVWTDWTGYQAGTDLFAQRVGPAAAPLEALAAVYGDATSAWQLSFSWLAPAGVSVSHYEVSFNEGNPVVVNDNFWTSPDVLPGTLHSLRVRYQHQDGRVSPWSAAIQARTWGKDDNADGLPDDWQRSHFGNDNSLWPAPGVDSDGDGVSNRNEFLAGTSPSDAADVLKMAVTAGGQGIHLGWNSRPGAFYQVQGSADLSSWSNVGVPRLAAGNNDGVVIAGESASAYYRIKRVR